MHQFVHFSAVENAIMLGSLSILQVTYLRHFSSAHCTINRGNIYTKGFSQRIILP